MWSLVFIAVGVAVLVLNTVSCRAVSHPRPDPNPDHRTTPTSPFTVTTHHSPLTSHLSPSPSPGELELPHDSGRTPHDQSAPRSTHQAAPLRGEIPSTLAR